MIAGIEEPLALAIDTDGAEDVRARMRAAYDVSLFNVLSQSCKNLSVSEASVSLRMCWKTLGANWGTDHRWIYDEETILDGAKRLEERGLIQIHGDVALCLPMRAPNGRSPHRLQMLDDFTDYKVI